MTCVTVKRWFIPCTITMRSSLAFEPSRAVPKGEKTEISMSSTFAFSGFLRTTVKRSPFSDFSTTIESTRAVEEHRFCALLSSKRWYIFTILFGLLCYILSFKFNKCLLHYKYFLKKG